MQAVLLTAFGSPDHFQLADVPTPMPQPGEARVRVHAAGFNPADYQTRQGGGTGLALPLILGLDIAGTIDGLGDGVDDVRVGDRVYGYLPPSRRSNGGYAEYACVPTAFLAPLPTRLTFAQGASLPVASLTAYQCLVEDVRLVAGQPLFMTGATGGVGTMALQMAKVLGAHPIITTAGGPSSVAYLSEVLGVEPRHILHYPGRSLAELVEEAITINCGNRYAVALDCVGGLMTSLCCRIIDAHGHVISIVDGPTNDGDTSDVEALFAVSGTFHTTITSARATYKGPERWADYRRQLMKIAAWITAGQIAPPPLTVLAGLSVATVRDAHQRLETGHVHGKIIMTVCEQQN